MKFTTTFVVGFAVLFGRFFNRPGLVVAGLTTAWLFSREPVETAIATLVTALTVFPLGVGAGWTILERMATIAAPDSATDDTNDPSPH